VLKNPGSEGDEKEIARGNDKEDALEARGGIMPETTSRQSLVYKRIQDFYAVADGGDEEALGALEALGDIAPMH
jgi:hypothetical protein